MVAYEAGTVVVEWGGAKVSWKRLMEKQRGSEPHYEDGESDCRDVCQYDVYAVPNR